MKRGLVIGALVGGIFSLLTVVAGTFALVDKRSKDMRRGWKLVPVAVAARPLKRGERIATGALDARSIPEQFVTGSVIKEAQIRSVDQRIVGVDLAVNAMVRWADLEPEQPDPVRECLRRAVTK